MKESPRKEGDSATLAKRVAAGAETAGATVETYYPHSLNIKPCDACREQIEKDCILEDDMKELAISGIPKSIFTL